tara:strand:+ start:514 stop:681 length:168 start_codon:yes stop_codon:yes gene_type:complete
LQQLKKELGLPENITQGEIEKLNIESAIHEAVDQHAAIPERSHVVGYVKAQGLDN